MSSCDFIGIQCLCTPLDFHPKAGLGHDGVKQRKKSEVTSKDCQASLFILRFFVFAENESGE
jgi:hypothetical protein